MQGKEAIMPDLHDTREQIGRTSQLDLDVVLFPLLLPVELHVPLPYILLQQAQLACHNRKTLTMITLRAWLRLA